MRPSCSLVLAALLVLGSTVSAADSESQQPPPEHLLTYDSGHCSRTNADGERVGPSCPAESVLQWRFEDDLELQFTVWGNCCPESLRFVVSSELHGDTLAIAVVDTAAHLCRCTCRYGVSCTLTGLAGDAYVVTGVLGKEHEIFPATGVVLGSTWLEGSTSEESVSPGDAP